MSSQGGGGHRRGSGQHAATPPRGHAPGPKLQVQRSVSRDTITIHFSALGKEEEDEEEELYGPPLPPAPGGPGDTLDDDTGLETGEELLLLETTTTTTSTPAQAAVLPVPSSPAVPSSRPGAASPPHASSPAVAILPPSSSSHSPLSSTPPASASWPSSLERPLNAPHTATAAGFGSTSSSPSRSSSKPFLSLVRTLSNDVEAPPPSHAPPPRRRDLMISFVKSLSADASKPSAPPAGPPLSEQQELQHLPSTNPAPQVSSSHHQRTPLESRRNVQLFKQFSQPRLCTGTAPPPAPPAGVGGDSKTAPSSPQTPPDGRSFFKVQEVEARIEDTKRRFSEAMSDRLHLFSKMMGDETPAAAPSAPHRVKSLSTSVTELSAMATAVNGHVAEGNNNNSYSIKEEEAGDGEEQEDTNVFFSFPSLVASTGTAPPLANLTHTSAALPRSPSLTLGRCSMSALAARQEDEDFCELYSEDFELCTDTETPDGEPSRGGATTATARLHRGGFYSELDTEEEEEEGEGGEEEEDDSVPVTGLILLTQVVYWYLVLPLPGYVCAVVHGVVGGFMLAVLVLWLSAQRGGSADRLRRRGRRRRRRWGETWNNLAPLDIKQPAIFKGWMNEIQSYDPETYHATLTHSVYVRLEGSVLRLSKPNRNVARRATHNEPKPDVTYVSQKIYDLADSKIQLVPQSLARKRVWNKKYPICIQLAKQEDFMSKAQGDSTTAGDDNPNDKAPGAVEKAERPDRGDNRPDKGEKQAEKAESCDAPGPVAAEEPKRPAGAAGAELTIYLFGRTGREKEEWFRRFLMASRLKSDVRSGVSKSAFPPSRSGSLPSGGGGGVECEDSRAIRQKVLLDYHVYMAKYVSQGQDLVDSPTTAACTSPVRSAESSPRAPKKLLRAPEESGEPEAWVNALLGRIFWDFLGERYWANVVSKKIQMKLSKIRLPYFMNELTLTALDMGFAIPKILRSYRPTVDQQGLWFDLEVSYKGSFLMSLETKMNLSRLGKEGDGPGEQGKEGPRTYCLADSDEESSSAGSSDEEDPPELLTDKPVMPGAEGYVGGHRPSKIMRFVDKIARSRYFQKARETEFIKKKMEEVSNTPLLLTVEVQECRGTLAVNIPPPPTDRIWYGFRSPPHLELKARPKLGEREVTIAHVTDWIEKKLDQEFQKIFVMPNMDDIWLPIMHSAMDTRSNDNLVTVTTTATATTTDTAAKDSETSQSDDVSDM